MTEESGARPLRRRDGSTTNLVAANRAEDRWSHLERAHVVSQPWPWPHTRVHAAMLARALRERDRNEVVGQIVRLIVAGPGSLSGKFPEGNTGRSIMGLTQTAEIPDELATILAKTSRQ